MTTIMRHEYKDFVTQEYSWNLRECDPTGSTTLDFDDALKLELQKKARSVDCSAHIVILPAMPKR